VSSTGRVVASALLMGVAVYLLRSWPLVIVVIVGAAVYAGALYALRALNAEEWSIVRGGFTSR
jgi:hypothetical protein